MADKGTGIRFRKQTMDIFMSKQLQMKVAKAMYDCQNNGDAPIWEEAEDSTRNWLLSRADAAIEAVHDDLKQYVERNLINEAAVTGKMLIKRLRV